MIEANKKDDFPSTLKAYREANDITQQELADDIGMSKNVINMYETGLSLPNVKNLIKIADYFGITVDELLGRKIEL